MSNEGSVWARDRVSEKHNWDDSAERGLESTVSSLEFRRFVDLFLLAGTQSDVATWMIGRARQRGASTLAVHVNANNYYWMRRLPKLREDL